MQKKTSRIAVKTIIEYLKTERFLKNVHTVLFSEDDYITYANVLKELVNGNYFSKSARIT
ncbi:MAG: hypothetical protein ABIA63_05580 [bacterium]